MSGHRNRSHLLLPPQIDNANGFRELARHVGPLTAPTRNDPRGRRPDTNRAHDAQWIGMQHVYCRRVRARHQHVAVGGEGDVEGGAADGHAFADSLHRAMSRRMPQRGTHRSAGRPGQRGPGHRTQRAVADRDRKWLPGVCHAALSIGAAVTEVQQGDCQALTPNLGPALARHTAHQPVGDGGIDALAVGQLAQRHARRLGFEHPVQRACPPTDHFEGGQSLPAQCAGELIAIMEAEPLGEFFGTGGMAVDATQHAQ